MLYLESIMQTKHEVGSLKMQDLHLYRYYRIDAEIRLAKAKEPAAK